MMEKLEYSNLQKITLSQNAVRWHKKGKEIVIGNTLFDVKSSVIKKDSIIFTGLFDEKETLIKARVTQMAQNTQSSSNKLAITKLVFQVWYSTNDSYNLFNPLRHLILRNDSWYKEKLLQVYNSPKSPPPKTN